MQRSSSRRLCMNFFFSFQNGVLFGRPLNILSFPAENFEVTRKTIFLALVSNFDKKR